MFPALSGQSFREVSVNIHALDLDNKCVGIIQPDDAAEAVDLILADEDNENLHIRIRENTFRIAEN